MRLFVALTALFALGCVSVSLSARTSGDIESLKLLVSKLQHVLQERADETAARLLPRSIVKTHQKVTITAVAAPPNYVVTVLVGAASQDAADHFATVFADVVFHSLAKRIYLNSITSASGIPAKEDSSKTPLTLTVPGGDQQSQSQTTFTFPQNKWETWETDALKENLVADDVIINDVSNMINKFLNAYLAER